MAGIESCSRKAKTQPESRFCREGKPRCPRYKTTKWSEGLRFVQFQKNSCHHVGIKRAPYKAMFGVESRLGLKDSALPSAVVSQLNTEEDLESVLSSINNVSKILKKERLDLANRIVKFCKYIN